MHNIVLPRHLDYLPDKWFRFPRARSRSERDETAIGEERKRVPNLDSRLISGAAPGSFGSRGRRTRLLLAEGSRNCIWDRARFKFVTIASTRWAPKLYTTGRSVLTEIRIAVIYAERSEGKSVHRLCAKCLLVAFRRVIARRQAITRGS